jgi:hypothetical protein
MSARDFSKLVQATTGFRGAYPEIVPVQVGDFYELSEAGMLVKQASIFDWGGWKDAVQVESHPVDGSSTYYAGCQRENEVEAGAGAVVPGAGVSVKAKVSLSFSHDAGFVLAFQGTRRDRIRDVPTLQRWIKDLAEKDQWQEQWVLVIEVLAASSASLVVTSQRGSRIDLSANAELPDLLEKVAIADPSLGWTASSWKGSGSTSLCRQGTPLYHCIKVKRNWLGTLSTQVLGPDDDAALAAAFTDDPFE